MANLEAIKIPAYVVASYTNTLNTEGSFHGFQKISSKEKWLRVENTSEWPDYNDEGHVEDLRKFFACYLKGVDNDWKETPTVRLAVLDPGHQDTVGRPETSWPPAGLNSQTLYLQPDLTLGETASVESGNISYSV